MNTLEFLFIFSLLNSVQVAVLWCLYARVACSLPKQSSNEGVYRGTQNPTSGEEVQQHTWPGEEEVKVPTYPSSGTLKIDQSEKDRLQALNGLWTIGGKYIEDPQHRE